MVKVMKSIAIFLLILIGYHFINHSLGFTLAQSFAIIFFAFFLLALYEPNKPDAKNWLGWLLIVIGLLILSTFTQLNLWLLFPLIILFLGYRLAELYINFSLGSGTHGGGDSGGCDFGSNGGGDGGGE